jgi:hypothetical protein
MATTHRFWRKAAKVAFGLLLLVLAIGLLLIAGLSFLQDHWFFGFLNLALAAVFGVLAERTLLTW